MSIQTMAWVLKNERQTAGVTRMVLLALANYANDETGQAYPAVRRLARDCNCSKRAVQYALTELEQMGLITRLLNAANDHRIPVTQRPNVYVIHTRADSSPGAETPCKPRQDPVQSATSPHADVCTQNINRTIREPSAQPRCADCGWTPGDHYPHRIVHAEWLTGEAS